MTNFERYWGALSREYTPDRVCCSVNIGSQGVCALQGDPIGVAYTDFERMRENAKKTYEMLGGWDFEGQINSTCIQSNFNSQIRWRLPGIDLPFDAPTPLADEMEQMKFEEYEDLIELGWNGIAKKFLNQRVHGCPLPERIPVEKIWQDQVDFVHYITNGECEPGWALETQEEWPFFALSLTRGFIPFSQDLFFHGDVVEKALNRMVDDYIDQIDNALNRLNQRIIYTVDERASGANFPMKIFERFWFPGFKKLCEYAYDRGAVVVIHLDTNWSKNIPYFKELPPHTVSCQFDSLTPLKDVYDCLGDHIQYQGDVNGSLLTYGTQEEVRDYCKQVIDTVGRTGGFILQAGCEVPPDARPENIIAMLETAKNYRY